MTVYVMRGGQLVDRDTGQPAELGEFSGACPAVRKDSIRPLKSMVDGRMYDSRSDYDKSLADAGMRVVDPGEPIPTPNTDFDKRKIIENGLRKMGYAE